MNNRQGGYHSSNQGSNAGGYQSSGGYTSSNQSGNYNQPNHQPTTTYTTQTPFNFYSNTPPSHHHHHHSSHHHHHDEHNSCKII